jgi:hypothetical protein
MIWLGLVWYSFWVLQQPPERKKTTVAPLRNVAWSHFGFRGKKNEPRGKEAGEVTISGSTGSML